METIGERIKYLRTTKNVSLQELADVIGKSKSNIHGYENNSYEPSAQTIIALCKFFDISSDWLLLGKEFQYQNFSLTEQEKKIIWMYQQLNSQDKTYVNDTVEMLYNKALKKGTLSGSMTGGTGEEAAASETA